MAIPYRAPQRFGKQPLWLQAVAVVAVVLAAIPIGAGLALVFVISAVLAVLKFPQVQITIAGAFFVLVLVRMILQG